MGGRGSSGNQSNCYIVATCVISAFRRAATRATLLVFFIYCGWQNKTKIDTKQRWLLVLKKNTHLIKNPQEGCEISERFFWFGQDKNIVPKSTECYRDVNLILCARQNSVKIVGIFDIDSDKFRRLSPFSCYTSICHVSVSLCQRQCEMPNIPAVGYCHCIELSGYCGLKLRAPPAFGTSGAI